MNNMDIYNACREVPDSAKKAFNNGSFSGTDINPMWRIKTLTEQFGPAGIGWYYEVLSERCEQHHDSTMAIVDLNLYIKVNGEWSKPIFGTGGNLLVRNTKSGPKASDEGYKMALTDALSVACKALGVGADVYFEKDRTKYTESAEKPVQENKTALVTDKERKRTFAMAMKKFGEDKDKVKQFYAENGVDYFQMTADQYVKIVGLLADGK